MLLLLLLLLDYCYYYYYHHDKAHLCSSGQFNVNSRYVFHYLINLTQSRQTVHAVVQWCWRSLCHLPQHSHTRMNEWMNEWMNQSINQSINIRLIKVSSRTLLFITICVGPYLRGIYGIKPSEMLTSFSTLFQHISAVAAVNIVTILSRSIAFSFHLKCSVTLKKCCKGSALDPAGELMTLPRTHSGLGRGNPFPIPTPSWRQRCLDIGAFSTSFQWNSSEIFSAHSPESVTLRVKYVKIGTTWRQNQQHDWPLCELSQNMVYNVFVPRFLLDFGLYILFIY